MSTQLEAGDWPLWRHALRKLTSQSDFGYGMKRSTGWFEEQFGCARDSNEFAFAMLNLRKELEESHGYYLTAQTIQDDETQMRMEVWQIPSAADHCGAVSEGFETKLRRYGERAVHLRAKTLANPSAQMAEADRAKAEKALEIAATRMVLLRRERSVANYLRENAPKMLAKKQG